MKRFMNGWNISKVVLSPQEIEQVLSGFHHINFQSRVSVDYIESDSEDFFGSYRKFYEKFANEYQFKRKLDWKYFGWYTGITDDLSKCTYGTPFHDTKDNQIYKTSAFSEPCVGIGPFALYITEDKKLHTNYSYMQFPQFTVGIQIEYPKLFVRDESGQEVEAPTETFKVYGELCSRVKSISKGLVFTIARKYRANVKIGQDARNDFMKSHFTAHYGCTWL